MVETLKTVSTKPELMILYGSETGNCEQISADLQEELNTGEHSDFFSSALAKRQVQRFTLDQYKKAKLADKTGLKMVLVICSSTGDGEGPENT